MNLYDPWHWLVGNIRYQLYYDSRFKWLIRKHIREQIAWRIEVMNPLCYSQGSCIACGCKTTALQMCNKSCEAECYPPMKSKKEWNKMEIG